MEEATDMYPNDLQDLTSACPKCGTQNPGSQLTCSLCSEVLRRDSGGYADPDRSKLFEVDASGIAGREADPYTAFTEPKPDYSKQAYTFLGLGLVLAPVFAYMPFLGFFNWFLGALFHESGHCLFGWLMGQPAYPAISLQGHAVAIHQGQSTILALGICSGLAIAAWTLRARRGLAIAFAIAAVVQPMLAFTQGKEVLFLLGGHLGELGMATVCIWRTLCGGFTENSLERVLYSILGWYLVGSNVALCAGLMFSQAARLHYAGNGSFGLTNDYLRVANDVLGTSLGTVAFGMLLIALIPVPLAWFLMHRRSV